MPIYEFWCKACRRDFEALILNCRELAEASRCPHCGGKEVERLLSCFCAATSSSSGVGKDSGSACGTGSAGFS